MENRNDFIFIFNNEILDEESRIKNSKLINNSIIYVCDNYEINIVFKINKMGGNGCPIIVKIKKYDLCSDLFNCYLKKFDFSYRNKISKFIFNSKELDENLIVINSGLKNGSIIYVELKESLQKLTIIVKYKEIKKMECMKFYLLSTLIDRYEFENKRTFLKIGNIRLKSENGKEDKILNKDLSIEKLGLKDNDFIYNDHTIYKDI